MRAGLTMLHKTTTTTVMAAASQGRVERLQRLSINLSYRDRAEQRPNVLVDLSDVAKPGGHLDVEHIQPAVKQLIHRRVGTRIALFVDLRQQARTDLLGLTGGVGAGRDRLGQILTRS